MCVCVCERVSVCDSVCVAIIVHGVIILIDRGGNMRMWVYANASEN